MAIPSPPRLLRTLAAYLTAVALSLACLTGLTQLWKLDLAIPFDYSHDALIVQLWVHSVHETGWYLHNDRVGTPGGGDLHDFPLFDSMHFLLIKLLACLTGNPFVTCNLFFLLTFPLTTVSALFVFRHFQCAYATSLVGSLLFTFLPYHFLRGTSHLFLASYYHVPLLVMVMLWVYRGDAFLTGRVEESRRPWWLRLRGKAWAALLICGVAGSGGVYYAFFACCLLAVLGLAAAVQRRSARPVATASVLVGLIVLAGLANLTPSLIYWTRHGPNPERAGRMPAEAEIYGLRIAQLLLPVTHHRLAWLAHLKDRYNRAALLVNENDSAALGLIGGAGFLLLLLQRAAGFIPAGEDRTAGINPATHSLWEGLSFLNLGAVLLAVRGGLGGLIAMRLTWIRGYNRISVFIGFFALFAVVLGLEALRRRYARSARANAAYLGLLGLLLCGGLLDQAPRGCIVPAARVRPAFAHDAAFLQRVEAAVPAQSMIFQLPYAAFPEQGAVEAMGDYELLRACLHSRTLRWSHGAMRGREADAWQRAVAGQPPPELVRTLIQVGFSGIYVDRFGYRDRAVKLEKALTGLIGREPLVSGNGRLAFFSLSPLRLAFRAAVAPATPLTLPVPPCHGGTP